MEKEKKEKTAVMLAGIAACLVIIAIVLAFISSSITGNSIKTIENKVQNTINTKDNSTIKNLSGEGIAYVCVDSSGNLFRSNIPCR